MDFEVALAEPSSSDMLRELHNRLLDELRVLHGHIDVVEAVPHREAMGPTIQSLLVHTDPETVGAVAAVVVAWLRSRRSRARIEITIGRNRQKIDVITSDKYLKHRIAELIEAAAAAEEEGDDGSAGELEAGEEKKEEKEEK